MIEILQGDCRDVLSWADVQADAVVTDPPYGLEFMGKGWDKGVPGVEFWEAILANMKPGAHLLAFGGTRTYHWLACAIEDAGFEMRDCLMWVYGSGFPKSLDVSKAIDKAAGAKREVVGRGKSGRTAIGGDGEVALSGTDGSLGHDITTPATDEAQQWQGWGTALKPAWEPIIVARKPFKTTVAANVLEHGTGALNIDASRVGADGGCRGATKGEESAKGAALAGSADGSLNGDFAPPVPGLGRWPANLIHDGSDEVLHAFPGEGEKSEDRFFYCAKTSKAERGEGNNHPTVKPQALMRYLVKLVTPPGGTVLEPFMGSGSTLVAAQAEGFEAVGIDLSPEYCEIARNRISKEDFLR